jgi:hypothetical protein
LVVLAKGGTKRDYIEIGSLTKPGFDNELSIVHEEATEYGRGNGINSLSLTVVPSEFIKKNGYDLSFNKYESNSLQAEYLHSEYRKLKDVLLRNFRGKDVPKYSLELRGLYPYIQVKDIAKFAGNIYSISPGHNSFIDKDLSDADRLKLVPSGSILVSMIGVEVNSVLYSSYTPAIISKNLLALVCDTSIVLPEYILSQFQEGYFKEQVNNITKGHTIPFRSNSDFLNLSIKLPSIEEQERFISTFLQQLYQMNGILL